MSNWSRAHYINSRKTIDTLITDLDTKLSRPAANDPLISELNKKLLLAYKAEEEYWKQRSRQLWFTLGDKNTGFFHASTRGRRARNRLTVLETDAGEDVFEKDLIVSTITDYFQSIFASSTSECVDIVSRAIRPSITQTTNDRLISIPSETEIREALFSIHPDKALGPDGFSASFFQSNWTTVKPALVKEIQDFFST